MLRAVVSRAGTRCRAPSTEKAALKASSESVSSISVLSWMNQRVGYVMLSEDGVDSDSDEPFVVQTAAE